MNANGCPFVHSPPQPNVSIRCPYCDYVTPPATGTFMGFGGIDWQSRALAAEARIERLTKALEPFAKIKPSSLYPDDGSEAEGYLVLLQGAYSNPVSFTGADLALARAALRPQQGEG